IDVVILCGKKDKDVLHLAIDSIRKYGKDIRKVVVVSPEKFTNSAEWFDEKNYPFSKKDVIREIFQDEKKAEEYLQTPKNRANWLYQQLLKFYAPFVIPGLGSHVLVLDSEVIFLKPVAFLGENGESLFPVGTEHYEPYFEHAKRLIPGFTKVFPSFSGICHHMIFQKEILQDLFHTVEGVHHTEFWKAFCRCCDHKELFGSFASEYEIYFNYVFIRTDQMKIRPLKWMNIPELRLSHYKRQGYDFVAYQDWCRRTTPKEKKGFFHKIAKWFSKKT
ncbi:MAG: DUF6492 family protein, partial [Chlamydiota bacterium]